MGQIKLSQHICWVFSSSFDQKFLYFTSSKTQIVTVIFTSAKLNWLWGSFQRLNRSKMSLLSDFLDINRSGKYDTSKISNENLWTCGKIKRTKRKKLLWKHSTQIPTGGGTGSLFSMSTADNSDWGKVNITWIIYVQRWACL